MKTAIGTFFWLVVCAAVCILGCRPNKSPLANSAKAVAEYQPSINLPTPVEPPVSPIDNASDITASDEALKTTATANPESMPSTAAAQEQPSMPAIPAQTATWTTQRMVLTGRGGPRFLKLDVNVGHQDLEAGFQASLANIAQELQLDFANPCDWNELLDKPVIAAGWLGNLVPNVEQREQLRGLYDTNTNEKVDESEFRAFLTRGLSRTGHLKLISRPSTAPRLPSNSVWGPVDKDENGELSPEELAETLKTMSRFDFDSDRIWTASELRSAIDSDSNMFSGSSNSMLEMKPVHAWDLEKPEKMARPVSEHYSFSEGLSNEMLTAWPVKRFQLLDSNRDSMIDPKELAAADDKVLDGEFRLTFADVTQALAEKQSVNFQSIDELTRQRWHGHPTGGRLTLDGCIVTIVLIDEQNEAIRESFRTQFGRIAKDAQGQSFAMQVLELKKGAFDCLNASADKQQVEAADLAWRWLVAPRHWHVQFVWSASDSPWFELMDLNGDQKLVTAELEQFASQALSWDGNKDGSIQTEEMPVSVLLEVRRSEARGLRSRLGGTAVEKRGTNESSAPTWFTGMDYNSDGELSLSEFLGEQSDFEKFDRDRNGIIEAREVTTPQ